MSQFDFVVLERIIQRHFGNTCMIDQYEIVDRKEDYAVVILTLANPSNRFVLKLAGKNAAIASPFDRTFALTKQVREQTGVPTFEALAVDMSYEYVPYRYLLTTYVEGVPWAGIKDKLTTSELVKVYRDFGRAVAHLHTLTFKGFGEFNPDNEIKGKDYLSALITRSDRRIKNPNHQRLVEDLLEQNKHLFEEAFSPRLAHEDLNPGNIILCKQKGVWELAGIIDFDSAWSGLHESDLARLELWRGMVGPGFFEEYERIQPISEGYPDRRPFLQLLWCLEFAVPSEEHRMTTKGVCDRLGIPPITF